MSDAEFRLLYDTYHEFSARIIYRIIKNKTEMEELCNDVFYRIYKMGEKLDLSDERKLRAFIATTSKNCALDYLKRSYVIHEQCTIDDDNWEEIPDLIKSPEEQFLNMEKATYQRMVLARLREKSEKDYDIIVKVNYFGFTPDEVAKEYEMTRNNINNRILRARKWLKEELRKTYE